MTPQFFTAALAFALSVPAAALDFGVTPGNCLVYDPERGGYFQGPCPDVTSVTVTESGPATNEPVQQAGTAAVGGAGAATKIVMGIPKSFWASIYEQYGKTPQALQAAMQAVKDKFVTATTPEAQQAVKDGILRMMNGAAAGTKGMMLPILDPCMTVLPELRTALSCPGTENKNSASNVPPTDTEDPKTQVTVSAAYAPIAVVTANSNVPTGPTFIPNPRPSNQRTGTAEVIVCDPENVDDCGSYAINLTPTTVSVNGSEDGNLPGTVFTNPNTSLATYQASNATTVNNPIVTGNPTEAFMAAALGSQWSQLAGGGGPMNSYNWQNNASSQCGDLSYAGCW